MRTGQSYERKYQLAKQLIRAQRARNQDTFLTTQKVCELYRYTREIPVDYIHQCSAKNMYAIEQYRKRQDELNEKARVWLDEQLNPVRDVHYYPPRTENKE